MNQRKTIRSAKLMRRVLMVLAVCVLWSVGFSKPAMAQCPPCGCEDLNHGSYLAPPGDYSTRLSNGGYSTIRGAIVEEHNLTADHILEEFNDQEAFMLDEVWLQHLRPALMMMTEQITHVAMMQMFVLGTMFDAKQDLEVQALFQELAAEAHKDYQSSHGMCVFGTTVRSLASSERNAEYTTFVMSQRSIDRQLGNMRQSSARGAFDDHCYRLRQFRERYCDRESNNRQMELICDPPGTEYDECRPDSINVTYETRNKDVNFTQVVDRAATLEVDFYTGAPATALSEDETDIFALSNNLYSNDIMYRVPEAALRYRDNQAALLGMRSIVAKRSVAENSFNTIIGMKAQGTEESTTLTMPYLSMVWEALGVTDAAALENYLGERPSYDAQMEVLTKRMYQQPEFFTTLYDEPANVDRKGVALQAIGLMQQFDTWNSHLRTEAMLSVLLELELMNMQERIDNLSGGVRATGINLGG